MTVETTEGWAISPDIAWARTAGGQAAVMTLEAGQPLLLSASGILLDHEILEAGPDELARRHESLVWASETLLGARPGSLSILAEAGS